MERRENSLQLARLALLEAESRLRSSDASVLPSEAYDQAYGFNRRYVGVYTDAAALRDKGMPPIPQSAFVMAVRTFTNELNSLVAFLRRDKRKEMEGLESPSVKAMVDKLSQLTLSNSAIWEREHSRPPIRAPWVIKAPYYALCYALDNIFEGRPLARLWFLETVARVPYLSYIAMLHLYESLGWWRVGSQAKRVHFAEEWNEYHHLLIMETLGGDRLWVDRFMAGHSAVLYFWVLCVLWLVSPTLAYNFSELIEAHAVDTYGQFVDENEELLKSMPAPAIARTYYTQDMYMYDEFQTSKPKGSRRPKMDTLCVCPARVPGIVPPHANSFPAYAPSTRYDVFTAIRDDEGEHVNTMAACQDPEVLVRSPNVEAAIAASAAALALAEAVLFNVPEDGIAAILAAAEDFIESGGGGLL